ncbi:hypothetical protein ACFWDI_26540 [Streptomyces sp. NPDC060064]|uniref:hypothetical protein n=1 Tax=Streptomyces sp. NPDC060064 TaxID=3347049 RepID=UPI00369B026D
MPIPVHALAYRPLTAGAVAELLALPAAPHVPDDVDAIGAEMQQRGWSWEHELVCDSFRTGYGHVLCTDGLSPFGHPDVRYFLVFGELYPVDPDDEQVTNVPWLNDLMADRQQLPGWSSCRPGTDQDCETVLAHAAQAATEHLGTAPAVPTCPPPTTKTAWPDGSPRTSTGNPALTRARRRRRSRLDHQDVLAATLARSLSRTVGHSSERRL